MGCGMFYLYGMWYGLPVWDVVCFTCVGCGMFYLYGMWYVLPVWDVVCFTCMGCGMFYLYGMWYVSRQVVMWTTGWVTWEQRGS